MNANLNNGEFDFDAPANDSGYRQWQEEIDSQKKAIEHRWGVILGRRVRLQLKGYDKAVEGVIRVENHTRKTPLLRINDLRFTPAEIDTLSQI